MTTVLSNQPLDLFNRNLGAAVAVGVVHRGESVLDMPVRPPLGPLLGHEGYWPVGVAVNKHTVVLVAVVEVVHGKVLKGEF